VIKPAFVLGLDSLIPAVTCAGGQMSIHYARCGSSGIRGRLPRISALTGLASRRR
jgi:hypothetical protein